MLTQAFDYRDECNALYELLLRQADTDAGTANAVSYWTFARRRGTHMFDYAAKLTLQDPEAFAEFMREKRSLVSRGQSLTQYTRAWHGNSFWPGAPFPVARILRGGRSHLFWGGSKSPRRLGGPGYERTVMHQREANGNMGPRASAIRRARSIESRAG